MLKTRKCVDTLSRKKKYDFHRERVVYSIMGENSPLGMSGGSSGAVHWSALWTRVAGPGRLDEAVDCGELAEQVRPQGKSYTSMLRWNGGHTLTHEFREKNGPFKKTADPESTSKHEGNASHVVTLSGKYIKQRVQIVQPLRINLKMVHICTAKKIVAAICGENI